MKVIIYKTETGIAIVHPSRRGLNQIGIDNIIKKDIPRLLDGKLIVWDKKEMTYDEYLALPQPEYKIVEDTDIPTDRSDRESWTYDSIG